jgi:hypothetical protein
MADQEHYVEFDLDYDKDAILELYHTYVDEFPSLRNLTSPFKSVSEDLDLTDREPIKSVFEELFIVPNSSKFYSLTKLEKRTIPHTNPGCNGNIIIPLIGQLYIDIFAYEAPIVDGRPLLDPMPRNRENFTEKDEQELQQSHIKTITVTKPIVVNGLKVHSLMPSMADKPIFLAIRLPTSIVWDEVVSFFQTKM